MIKKRAKELSDILLAYSQGKIIQISNNGNHWVEWIATNPDSIFNYNYYRIKPKPKLVPFTFEDNLLFRDKWIIELGYTHISKIIKIFHSAVCFGDGRVLSYSELFHRCEFEDGSKCGKYVNE